MKKLITVLLFLVVTNSFAYRTYEEINAIKVNDVLFRLLFTVYPDCKFKIKKDKPSEFEFLINVNGTKACAATLPKLTARLDLYKTNQHAILTYRTILNEKKLEAKNLFKTIRPYYHAASKKAGLKNIPNPMAWVRDNCARVSIHEKIDICIVKLNLINDKVAEVVAEYAAQAAKVSACDLNITAIQNFDIDTVNTMTTAQLKNFIKYMAKIIKCRIK